MIILKSTLDRNFSRVPSSIKDEVQDELVTFEQNDEDNEYENWIAIMQNINDFSKASLNKIKLAYPISENVPEGIIKIADYFYGAILWNNNDGVSLYIPDKKWVKSDKYIMEFINRFDEKNVMKRYKKLF